MKSWTRLSQSRYLRVWHRLQLINQLVEYPSFLFLLINIFKVLPLETYRTNAKVIYLQPLTSNLWTLQGTPLYQSSSILFCSHAKAYLPQETTILRRHGRRLTVEAIDQREIWATVLWRKLMVTSEQSTPKRRKSKSKGKAFSTVSYHKFQANWKPQALFNSLRQCFQIT